MNADNTTGTTNQSVIIKVTEATDLYYGYICPFVGVVGVFLNMIVFAIFSKSSIFKELLYKYLKLQALFIAMDLLFTSFRPVFYWKHYDVAHTYVAHLYEKYLITYGASVVEMSAFVCLVMATFNYYLLIDNMMSSQRCFLGRVSCYYVVVLVVVVSIVLFLYQLFEYKIVCGLGVVTLDSNYTYVDNTTLKWICDIEYQPFHYTTFHMINEIFAFFVRDGLNLIILVVLNILIFVRVKQGMKKKMLILNKVNNAMQRENSISEAVTNSEVTRKRRSTSNSTRQQKQQQSSSNHGQHKSMRSISKTKYKLTVMVIMSSVNCALGRLPIMIFFIIRNFGETDAVLYFRKLAVVCVYLSYDFNFFFLYFTNKKFKMLFNQHLLTLLTCHRRKPMVRDNREVRSATIGD